MGILSEINKGVQRKPHMVLLHATDGVGKTTFGAAAPGAILLEAEEGSNNLDVARFPLAKSWDSVLKNLDGLIKEEHNYKSLVVDTLDWIEHLLINHVIATCPKKMKTMESAHGGYQAAYSVMGNLWKNEFTPRIQQLRENGMNIILLCHSQVTACNDPTTDAPYDRFELKLSESNKFSTRAYFRELVDSVLFAKSETFTKGEGKKARGYSTGERKLYTQWNAAFDAKTRAVIPFEMEFSWDAYANAVENAGAPTAEDLANEMIALAEAKAPADIRDKVISFLSGTPTMDEMQVWYTRLKTVCEEV